MAYLIGMMQSAVTPVTSTRAISAYHIPPPKRNVVVYYVDGERATAMRYGNRFKVTTSYSRGDYHDSWSAVQKYLQELTQTHGKIISVWVPKESYGR